jgi:DNA processing protein
MAMASEPPPVIFVRGEVSTLSARGLAVVGTRKVSDYGQKATQKLVCGMEQAACSIVSGLAYGVDALAHQASIQARLPTIAVLGSGIDVIMPSAHEGLARDILDQGGAIVSEYALGTQADKGTFPQRNRIIAWLTSGTLVVEGDVQSGALITARFALNENRTVMAVPGNIFHPGARGPNSLIQQGAVPITCAADICEALGWKPICPYPSLETPQSAVNPYLTEASPVSRPLVEPLPDPGLPEEDRAILACLSADPKPMDVLQQQLGWDAAHLQQRLTLLELSDHIVLLPGAKVRRA